MQRVMKYGVIAIILLAIPAVASASLIQDIINIEWSDDTGLVLQDNVPVDDPMTTLLCPVEAWNICGAPIADGFILSIGDSTISFRGGIPSNPSSTQLVFSDLDWRDASGDPIDGAIVDVLLSPNSTLLGPIFWTDDSVTLGNLTSSSQEDLIFTLELVTRHGGGGDVPEPATLFLVGLGLLALRRRA